MNHANLALENAPSISTPLRFFATAPIFLVIAALILIAAGPDVLSNRWDNHILAATHSITLGFISMCILGALFQILPVLASCQIPALNSTSWYTYISITSGTLLLIFGFMSQLELFFRLSIYILIPSLLYFSFIVFYALYTSHSIVASTRSLRFTLLSFLVSIIFGFILASGYAWKEYGLLRQYTDMHIAWASIGWVLTSIIAISYQVIPMFQITTELPTWIKKLLVPAIFIFLILLSLIYIDDSHKQLLNFQLSIILKVTISLFISVFIYYSIKHLLNRKKRMPDISLWFWVTGLSNLLLTIFIYLYSLFFDTNDSILLGVLFFAGVSIPIIIGMLNKIVPFLIWYHLHRNHGQNGPGISSIPLTTDIISHYMSLWSYRIYISSFLLLVLSIYTSPVVFYLAMFNWIILGSFLFYLIMRSIQLYHSILFKNT